MSRLATALQRETNKLVLRQERYERWVRDENARRQRRVGVPLAPLVPLRPLYWDWAPGFDPYTVRARSQAIVHSIERSLRDGAYRPRSPAGFWVPKPDGGQRLVSVFQVADNAVSSVVFKSLMAKNRGKISGRSYAYRSDLTAHDALQYVQAEFRRTRRLYVAEYDFSKYFDSIDHDHIRRTLHDERFLLTRSELAVVEAFLAAPMPTETEYDERTGPQRVVGVPQGTSISLFLANLAAAPLDRELERQGVSFVRYADDTLIWSTDYAALSRSVDILHSLANDIGAEINVKKSEGINLLVAEGTDAELRYKHSVDFVGYRVSLDELEMKTSAEDRIKDRLRELMFVNLLKPVFDEAIDPARLAGKVDRDYVVFIWQARRFLYGDLSERELRRFQDKGVPLRRFKGVMAYFPLIDDTDKLVELDRWLAKEVWLTMRRRQKALAAAGYTSFPPPLGLDRMELIKYQRTSTTTGGVLDLRLPSFRRIANIIRTAATQYGPNQIGKGVSPYDY